jgi:hypothetical protein
MRLEPDETPLPIQSILKALHQPLKRPYEHAPYDWIYLPNNVQIEDKSSTARAVWNQNDYYTLQFLWRDIALRNFDWLLLVLDSDNISQDILHCWLLPKNIVLRMLNKSSGGSILYGLGFGLGSTPGPCPSLKLPPVNHRWKANLMDKGRLSYAELHQVCLNASLEHFRLTRF